MALMLNGFDGIDCYARALRKKRLATRYIA